MSAAHSDESHSLNQRARSVQLGGALWWRRWSEPYEAVHGFMLLDDQFSDWVASGDELEENLREWGAGRFVYVGKTYRVHWLSDEDSAVVRVDDFGLDPL